MPFLSTPMRRWEFAAFVGLLSIISLLAFFPLLAYNYTYYAHPGDVLQHLSAIQAAINDQPITLGYYADLVPAALCKVFRLSPATLYPWYTHGSVVLVFMALFLCLRKFRGVAEAWLSFPLVFMAVPGMAWFVNWDVTPHLLNAYFLGLLALTGLLVWLTVGDKRYAIASLIIFAAMAAFHNFSWMQAAVGVICVLVVFAWRRRHVGQTPRAVGLYALAFCICTLPLAWMSWLGDKTDEIWRLATLNIANPTLPASLAVDVSRFPYQEGPISFVAWYVQYFGYAIAPIALCLLFMGLYWATTWSWPARPNADNPLVLYLLLLGAILAILTFTSREQCLSHRLGIDLAIICGMLGLCLVGTAIRTVGPFRFGMILALGLVTILSFRTYALLRLGDRNFLRPADIQVITMLNEHEGDIKVLCSPQIATRFFQTFAREGIEYVYASPDNPVMLGDANDGTQYLDDNGISHIVYRDRAMFRHPFNPDFVYADEPNDQEWPVSIDGIGKAIRPIARFAAHKDAWGRDGNITVYEVEQ